MLPLEWIKIVPVDKLEPGDLAFLLEYDHEAVLVGSLDGHVLLSYPADPKASLANVQNFDGNALVIGDWSIEVEHQSAIRFDHLDERKIGALIISKEYVSLTCLRQQGHGASYIHLPIRKADIADPPARYAFPDWRLVKMNGQEKVVLFERAAASAE